MLCVFVTNKRVDGVDATRGNAEETRARGEIGGFLHEKTSLAVWIDRQQDLRTHRVPPGGTQKGLNSLSFGEDQFGRISSESGDVIGGNDLE